MRVAVAVALMATVAAGGTNLIDDIRQTRAARVQGDLRGWLDAGRRTLRAVPDHPDLLISVSRAYAALGYRDEALDLLERAIDRGAGLEAPRLPEYAALKGVPRFEALTARARANLSPVESSSRFALLPAGDDFEGIGADPSSHRLFVGSNRGEIFQIDEHGAVSPFVSGHGLRQVLGINVDVRRGLLWAVSVRYPNVVAPEPSPSPDTGTGGLLVFRLGTGERVAAYELDDRPQLHAFNDVTIGPDGTAYVTDTNQNAVFRAEPNGKRLERFYEDPSMTFPNGIAISDDGAQLYVAHVEGVSAIALPARRRVLLAVPRNAAIHSIDGMVWSKNALIGVQNSPYLQRIIRIDLAPGGRVVTNVTVLSARSPKGYQYTTPAISGERIYVTGGTPPADPYGDAVPRVQPHVISLPLR
jgi:hypothetical protein